MADLVERVDALEERTDRVEHDVDVAVRRADRAATAHDKNVELLNALRVTQAEQGRTLAEHTRILTEHGKTLEQHSRLLTEFGTTLAEHTRILTLHTSRMDAIDGKLGGLALGMHTIELLLRRVVDEDGAASGR